MHLFSSPLLFCTKQCSKFLYALSHYISRINTFSRDCFSAIINSINNNVVAEVQRSDLSKGTKLVSGGVTNLSEAI